jgi:hypothetical protein
VLHEEAWMRRGMFRAATTRFLSSLLVGGATESLSVEAGRQAGGPGWRS